jgi:hypothetical protein
MSFTIERLAESQGCKGTPIVNMAARVFEKLADFQGGKRAANPVVSV